MASLKIENTGLIYRNAIPHVRSEHAYFPSVVKLDNGDLLASVVLGEAFESVNQHTHICRSGDNGQSWQYEGEIYAKPSNRVTSDFSRITSTGDGGVVAFMARADRQGRELEGLTNPETLGFVPTELMILRSDDYGRSWSEPKAFEPPLVGPSFEICSPITVLRDGRWVLSTQTWPGWDGTCPNGIKMVGLVSHDCGQSWPEYMDVMNEPGGETYFWESKIVELADRRLLAVAWVYDVADNKDRANHFAVSSDGGVTWSKPASMGIFGQTLTPLVLDDGRILCVYRRMDKAGLWANICWLDGQRWVNESEFPIWGADAVGLTASSENMSHNFNVLRFGAPCLIQLDDGQIFVAFWCYEDCVSVVRWFKLSIAY